MVESSGTSGVTRPSEESAVAGDVWGDQSPSRSETFCGGVASPCAQVRIHDLTRPEEATAALRSDLVACWVAVTNAGGAVGFPFPPVTPEEVAPVADEIVAGLAPDRSRLLYATVDGALAGWVHLWRNPAPLVAHWGTVARLQAHPEWQGRGIGSALLRAAQKAARDRMGLRQLHLSARAGVGLERFYERHGWREVGRWPGALQLAPDDARDEVLMLLDPL